MNLLAIAQRKKSEEHSHHANGKNSDVHDKEETNDGPLKVSKSNGTNEGGFCKGC